MGSHESKALFLPVNALRKAVWVMVPACIDEDRTTPEPHSPASKFGLAFWKRVSKHPSTARQTTSR